MKGLWQGGGSGGRKAALFLTFSFLTDFRGFARRAPLQYWGGWIGLDLAEVELVELC